jgi:hypothetical protein
MSLSLRLASSPMQASWFTRERELPSQALLRICINFFFPFSLICPPHGDKSTGPAVGRDRSCDDYDQASLYGIKYGIQWRLFCFISPWFGLTLILDDFSSVLFAAFREMSRQTEQ